MNPVQPGDGTLFIQQEDIQEFNKMPPAKELTAYSTCAGCDPEKDFHTAICVNRRAQETHHTFQGISTQALAVRTPLDLLNVAVQNHAAIDVIERLSALFDKERARVAEEQFNEAMNKAQSELGRIAPDLTNPQTKSRYASYAALDRRIRPIYVKHGFSLSFDTADSPIQDHIRAVCYVSNAGHTRRYQVDMPADGKGAKGGDVMTKTHATGAAMSYGMRYLLKFIFNIAIGEDDTDGNGPQSERMENLSEAVEYIENCRNMPELQTQFEAFYTRARKLNDQESMRALIAAKDKRKKELQ